ncbi:MAG: hypothetical protein CL910_14310 [Deltaproteobacteria bacterium]|jgi:CBS domain-containing protein|nr:hypothetical protein [Deltaproteobacteria bacterium]
MPRTTPIAQVMTSRVRSLGLDAKLGEVRQLLQAERCHHVPIVEGGMPAGIVSSRDLIRLLRGSTAASPAEIDDLLDRRSTVRETMSRDLVSMGPDESVDRAIDLIAEGDLHSVLVVDDEGRLVGIVTDRDLLAYLG